MVQKKLGDYGKRSPAKKPAAKPAVKKKTYRTHCETCRLYRACP